MPALSTWGLRHTGQYTGQEPANFQGAFETDFGRRATTVCQRFGECLVGDGGALERATLRFWEDPGGGTLIVLSGDWRSILEDPDRQVSLVLRLRSDGTFDETFRPPNGHVRRISDLWVDSMGGIYLTGVFVAAGETFSLLRLRSGGEPVRFAMRPGRSVEDL